MLAAFTRSRLTSGVWRLLPLWVLLISCGLVWALYAQVAGNERAFREAEFAQYSKEISATIEQRLLANEQILRGVAALYASSTNVSRSEFQTFVESLDLVRRYSGIQGVGFAQWIPASELSNHISSIRAEGFPSYSINPAGERQNYTAIARIEPFDWRNQRAFGYDMYVDPVRRMAMDRARDQGIAAISNRVTLVQETGQDVQAGFLIYLPIYRHSAPLNTVEARRDSLLGWAYSPLRMADFMHAILVDNYPDLAKHLELTVYDGESAAPENLLFHLGSAQIDNEVALSATRRIRISGATWTIQTRGHTGLTSMNTHIQRSGIILFTGLAIAVLASLLVWVLSSSHASVASALAKSARATTDLAERESLLRLIYDTSSVAIFLVDPNGRITHANRRMSEMFLCPIESLTGSLYVDHIHPSQREIGQQRMMQLLSQQFPSINVERLYWREDGSEFWGHLTGQPMRDASGAVSGLVGVIADIDERKHSEAALRQAKIVFDASPEGVIVTDADNRIVSINPAFSQITGYQAEDVIGKNPKILASGRQSPEFYAQLWQSLNSLGQWEGELWNRRKDGQIYPEMLSITRVKNNDGSVANYIALFQDITLRRKAEERIRHLAHHDYLTGLPNRAYFVERMNQALALARRYERQMAVLFIDLDRFKPINDNYGHDAGDIVLREIAKRLQTIVRESDTVCRQGGDEFVILVPEMADRERIEELSHKLQGVIEEPCTVADRQMSVSASIGVAIYPDHGDSVDSLMQSADSAMYQAKAEGSNRVCFARLTHS